MWDENSVYPKIETGVAFKPHMNDVFVEAFNIQTFYQDGKESAILKLSITIHLMLYFNLYQLKNVKNKEINKMRKFCIIDTLTTVDIQEIVKVGGEVIKFYKGALSQENLKMSHSRKFIEKLFPLRQKYKNEGNDLMQNLAKLIMNSLYGVQIRKGINES